MPVALPIVRMPVAVAVGQSVPPVTILLTGMMVWAVKSGPPCPTITNLVEVPGMMGTSQRNQSKCETCFNGRVIVEE